MTNIYLYGIAGIDEQYRIVRWKGLPIWKSVKDEKTKDILKAYAEILRFENPSIKRVYAMNNSNGLKEFTWDTFRKNHMDTNVIFKVTLEDEGERII